MNALRRRLWTARVAALRSLELHFSAHKCSSARSLNSLETDYFYAELGHLADSIADYASVIKSLEADRVALQSVHLTQGGANNEHDLHVNQRTLDLLGLAQARLKLEFDERFSGR